MKFETLVSALRRCDQIRPKYQGVRGFLGDTCQMEVRDKYLRRRSLARKLERRIVEMYTKLEKKLIEEN
jgi:hypothetical protein